MKTPCFASDRCATPRVTWRRLALCCLVGLASAGSAGAACDRPQTRPDDRYMVVEGSDGAEVLDKATGLVWQRCVLGKTWDRSTNQCSGSARHVGWMVASALEADADKPVKAGEKWRLPSYIELLSLVDMSCSHPAVNSKWFPEKDIQFLWSGTTYAPLGDYAWGLKYMRGEITYDNKVEEFQVRLVRPAR